MRNNNLKKKYLFVALFILLLVGVGFGYAALQTTLTINGNAKIKKTDWIVKFDNIQVTNGSYLNEVDSVPQNTAVISENDTKVTYTVTLSEPGQFYEFSVDIVNLGTLDAKLNAIRETGTTAEELAAVDFIEYTITGLPALNSVLQKGAANKKTVVIRVEYPFDIDADDLPEEDFTFTKTIELDYVQNR